MLGVTGRIWFAAMLNVKVATTGCESCRAAPLAARLRPCHPPPHTCDPGHPPPHPPFRAQQNKKLKTENSHGHYLAEAVSKLESGLEAEVSRRVESNRHVEAELKAFKQQVQGQLTDLNIAFQAGLERLSSAVQDLQGMMAAERGARHTAAAAAHAGGHRHAPDGEQQHDQEEQEGGDEVSARPEGRGRPCLALRAARSVGFTHRRGPRSLALRRTKRPARAPARPFLSLSSCLSFITLAPKMAAALRNAMRLQTVGARCLWHGGQSQLSAPG